MIKPLEKKENKNNLFKFKLFFLLFLFIIPFVYSFKAKQVNAPEILGEKAIQRKSLDIKKIENKLSDKLSNSIDQFREAGEKNLKAAQESITEFTFDQLIVNLIKEVEKLPKEQQEKIKEKICQ